MSDSMTGRRNNLVVIVMAMIFLKCLSLAFIKATAGGNVLDQLANKWDSVFYVNIAQHGYPSGIVNGNYAFPPVYPALIFLVHLVVGNYELAAVIVSNIFSGLTVVVFYCLAEIHFSPGESLYASLALAFFPTFVTFGLLAYSEPVYLFFAILAVYCFIKKRYFFAGATSSLAVLSGYSSLLIPIIFFAILLVRKIPPGWMHSRPASGNLGPAESHARKASRWGILWLAMPLIAFGLWQYVLFDRSGVLFALFTAQANWGAGIANPIAQFLYFFKGVFSTQGDPIQQMLMRYPYTLAFLFLAYPLWEIDKELALYSAAFMLFILSLVGTAYMSGPRLMLSAWPVLLVFGKSRKQYLIPVLVVFMVLSLESTHAQLTSFWT